MDVIERIRQNRRRMFWRGVRVFAAAAVASVVVYYFIAPQGFPSFAALITFIVVLGLGNAETAVRELWERKQDKPSDDRSDYE